MSLKYKECNITNCGRELVVIILHKYPNKTTNIFDGFF